MVNYSFKADSHSASFKIVILNVDLRQVRTIRENKDTVAMRMQFMHIFLGVLAPHRDGNSKTFHSAASAPWVI